MIVYWPQVSRSTIQTTVFGVGGVNLAVRLFQNNITVGPTTVLTDLTEANYDGYAAIVSSSWSAPAVDGMGDEFMLAPTLVFTRILGATPNTIYGWYITIGTGLTAPLLVVCNFDTPLNMILATDQIPLRPRLAMRSLAA